MNTSSKGENPTAFVQLALPTHLLKKAQAEAASNEMTLNAYMIQLLSETRRSTRGLLPPEDPSGHGYQEGAVRSVRLS